MPPALRALALLAAASGLAACTLDADQSPGFFEAVVFPGESLLGGTAVMVIDSNYIPHADDWERYDLHRYNDTVRVFVEDESQQAVEATLRGVVTLGASPASRFAQNHPGAWIAAAVFDLPDEQAFAYSGGSFVSEVTVTTRGESRSDEFHGTIRIVGTGGVPTQIGGIEAGLEPLLTARFRPVLRSTAEPNGFPEGARIAGLQVDVDYDSACLTSPRGFAATEAIHANLFLGPPSEPSPGIGRSRLVLTHPQGFELGIPSGTDSSAAGEGPLFDVVFDRGSGGCSGFSPSWVTLSNLYVVGVQGETLIDLRSAPDPDSTALFHGHLVDVP